MSAEREEKKMARRNYSNYTKQRPTSSTSPVRYEERTITKVDKEHNGERVITLTLSGGTKYSIKENDSRYKYSDAYFLKLWKELKVGDKVNVHHYGGRILGLLFNI